MSSLIELSRPLHPGLPVYPGDPPYRRQQTVEKISETRPGQLDVRQYRLQISSLSLSAHCGTHLDAPLHLWAEDAELPPAAVHQIPPEVLIGPARVVDLRGREVIEAEAMRALPPGPPRLLLRTDNSERPYSVERFVALAEEAARALVARAPLLIGVDGPSVDLPGATDLPVHRVLLGAGVVLLEGLDLCRAPAGDHELICLPLLLEGAEGAPARALLRVVG